jgi:hypothetical protein
MNVLRNLDRRVIYLAVLLTVAIPIYMQKTFPEQPTIYVKRVFDLIEGVDVGTLEGLPRGSRVLIALDFEPSSEAELAPMARAIIRHCCLRGHKMYFMTLWETAPPLIEQYVSAIVETEFADRNFEYGEDYVNLGYAPGKEAVIRLLVSNLKKAFTTDSRGTSLDKMKMTENITNLLDFGLVVNISAGAPGWKEWVQYAASPQKGKLAFAAGTTAVSAPQAYPYLPDQMFGLLAAIKGAAEYEAALAKAYNQENNKEYSKAMRQMAPQLWAHLLIIALIVLGNVIYFVDRRRGGRR